MTLVDVRRFLHTNENCRNVDHLEAWYAPLFGLRTVMRSVASDTDGMATYPPYTFPLPGTPIEDGLTILFLRDPDDIVVELVQRPRSFFR